MEKFLTKLKEQAQENPVLTLGAAAAVVTALTKLVDTTSAAKSRKAYAKQVNHRVKSRR